MNTVCGFKDFALQNALLNNASLQLLAAFAQLLRHSPGYHGGAEGAVGVDLPLVVSPRENIAIAYEG